MKSDILLRVYVIPFITAGGAVKYHIFITKRKFNNKNQECLKEPGIKYNNKTIALIRLNK